MRSAVAVAAFAATALAIPYVKRDEVVVTDIDLDIVTDIVTVYATGPAPEVTTTASVQAEWNQGHWGHSWGPSEGAWTPVAPEPSTTTTTPVAPPPAPTSTSVYVPPPTTESPVYTPPSTTETPVYVPPTSTYVAPVIPATTEAPQLQTWGEATATTGDGAMITWTESAAYTAYSDIVVMHHNFHRANHSSVPVVWNETLAESAQIIADSCTYAHNTDVMGGGYGQNIAAGVDMNNVSLIITDLFYNGEEPWYQGLYGEASPDMSNFEHWGHFSQIVWNTTTSVACATSNCTAGGLANVGSDTPPFFTVCNYFPSGNWGGEYGANIGSPIGLPTINWNAS